MKRFVLGGIKLFGRGIRGALLTLGGLAFLGGAAAIANYAATQGSGTTFGSVVIGGVHFVSQLICDATTANQCAAVSSGGALSVAGTVTANAGTNLNTSALATTTNVATVNTSINSVIGSESGGTAAGSSQLVGGVYNSTPPTLTNGQQASFQFTAAGSVHQTVDNTNANGQATMANSSPVVIASDQSAVKIQGDAASGAAVAGNPVLIAGTNGTDAYSMATDTSGHPIVVGAGTAGSASGGVVTIQGAASMTPVAVSYGGTALVADPCQSIAKSNTTVSQTSSGTLITGTSGKKNYICSLMILTSAAAEVSLVEYSGTCTGGTAVATLGSTTAANGVPLAANGGLTLGNGNATVVSGVGNANTGYNVCLLQAGTATVVAQATYVQQ